MALWASESASAKHWPATGRPPNITADLIAWHIARHTTERSDTPHLRHISRVVEAILRLAASTPAARHEAARILTTALTDWATATFER